MTDELIRKNDARAECQHLASAYENKGETEKQAAAEACDRAIAALPAVTVGVPTDCRKWPFYPIQMPTTKDGKGPATIGVDAASVSYEVWDWEFNTYASFEHLPDAINEAMRLSLAALEPVTQPEPAEEVGILQSRIKSLTADLAACRRELAKGGTDYAATIARLEGERAIKQSRIDTLHEALDAEEAKVAALVEAGNNLAEKLRPIRDDLIFSKRTAFDTFCAALAAAKEGA